MFGILISSENVQQILTHQMTLKDTEPMCDPMLYLRNTQATGKNWYYIRGYLGEVNNNVISWMVLPAYMFEKKFDYNKDKIKTDWDIIVRL